MNFESVLVNKKGCEFDLFTLKNKYSAKVLASLMGIEYFFKYPTKNMNRKCFHHFSRGRPYWHLKKDGTIKTFYKNKTLKYLLELEFNKIGCKTSVFVKRAINIIEKNASKFIKKQTQTILIIQKIWRGAFVRMQIKKAKFDVSNGVDFLVDIISQNTIYQPLIIINDFKNGNKVIYDKTTILSLVKTTKIPLLTFFNQETNQEEIHYMNVPVSSPSGYGYTYVSPFTRHEFDLYDGTKNIIKSIYFNVGRKLSHNNVFN